MIDFHCHILSEIDDGAASLEESLLMARELAGIGFTQVIATPHIIENYFMATAEKIVTKVEQLNEACIWEGIPLHVVPGAEIMLSPRFLEEFPNPRVPFLNASSYLLLEIPFSQPLPLYTEEVLFRIRTAGYSPILAHPERCLCFLQDPEKLYDLRRYDLLYQVNMASFAGVFGGRSRKAALAMLHKNMIDFLGSDAHRPGEERLLKVPSVLNILKDELGKDSLQVLLEDNPRKVLLDEPLELRHSAPEQNGLPSPRRFFFLDLLSDTKSRKKRVYRRER
jgi:protein-tyrosine phosphatase